MDFNINTLRPLQGAGRKLFIETYGCQMNVGDTEIVVSLMQREGYVYCVWQWDCLFETFPSMRQFPRA